MARTDPISSDALNSIKKQITGVIQRAEDARFSDGEEASLRLGRTMEVWGIKPEALAALMGGADPDQLGDWTGPTDRWHHQLNFSAEKNGFARSKPSPANPAEIELRRLGVSPSAEKINAAIKRVEQEFQSEPEKHGLPSPYDPLIRLLEVPPLRLSALLLIDEAHDDTHIYIVDSAPGNDRLASGKLQNRRDFLSALRSQPIPRGII
jgi:hypothetical protein